MSHEIGPVEPRLILASASPRRQQLLREARFDFVVHPAEIDEDALLADTLPLDLARELAIRKARAVSAVYPQDAVLAADTVVAFGDRSLGKPVEEREALRMLELLAGTTHIVITAVSLLCPARKVEMTRHAMSAVRMRFLTKREIGDYVAGGEWRGKAGGYGIQDHDPFVTRVGGSWTNVVGLPMRVVKAMLTDAGVWPVKRENETDEGIL